MKWLPLSVTLDPIGPVSEISFIEDCFIETSHSVQDLGFTIDLEVITDDQPEQCLPLDIQFVVDQPSFDLSTIPNLIEMDLEITDRHLDITIECIDPQTLPEYEGPYIVIPRKQEQVLETNEHRMSDDVTVLAINYSEILNQGGGFTATIGYE